MLLLAPTYPAAPCLVPRSPPSPHRSPPGPPVPDPGPALGVGAGGRRERKGQNEREERGEDVDDEEESTVAESLAVHPPADADPAQGALLHHPLAHVLPRVQGISISILLLHLIILLIILILLLFILNLLLLLLEGGLGLHELVPLGGELALQVAAQVRHRCHPAGEATL